MSVESLAQGQHYELISGVERNDLSPTMHKVGLSLGRTTVEHGLIGYGDNSPMRIHSELIYHEDLIPYFMLGCVEKAEEGGKNFLYDAVEAARIISEEQPEFLGIKMIYHAEHYDDTKAVVPLIRHKQGEDFLAFRQKKHDLNEVHNLPEGWSEEDFYDYIDDVLGRTVELEHTMEPGEILVVNNYKTLHVRTAFEGLRKMIRVRVDDPEAHKVYKVE
jgi:alpha-ketoglutarate-dependent taurine dioxygenase